VEGGGRKRVGGRVGGSGWLEVGNLNYAHLWNVKPKIKYLAVFFTYDYIISSCLLCLIHPSFQRRICGLRSCFLHGSVFHPLNSASTLLFVIFLHNIISHPRLFSPYSDV